MMVDLPAVTTTLAQIGETSSPIFNEFIQYFFIALGIFIGSLAIVWIFQNFIDLIGFMFSKKS